MATKRHSKTWEQQAKYYGVENIAEYMVETFLNGNISTFRELYKELKPAGRKVLHQLAIPHGNPDCRDRKNHTRNFLKTYDYGNEPYERNTSVPRHNRPVSDEKGRERPYGSGQAGKSLQDDGAVLRLYHRRGQEKRMLRFY